MGTEILADTDIVTYSEMLAVTDICALLHIDKSAALGKQVFGTAIAQAICHLAQHRHGGLRQVPCKSVIDYQPECSHLSARMGLWRKSS